jgi:hypothetical protein
MNSACQIVGSSAYSGDTLVREFVKTSGAMKEIADDGVPSGYLVDPPGVSVINLFGKFLSPSLPLTREERISATGKLVSAFSAIEFGERKGAVRPLEEFIAAVREMKSAGHLSDANSAAFVAEAKAIIQAL